MLYVQRLLKYMCMNEGLHSNLGIVPLERLQCTAHRILVHGGCLTGVRRIRPITMQQEDLYATTHTTGAN